MMKHPFLWKLQIGQTTEKQLLSKSQAKKHFPTRPTLINNEWMERNLEYKSKTNKTRKKKEKFGFHQALEEQCIWETIKEGFIKVVDGALLHICWNQYSGGLPTLFFVCSKLDSYISTGVQKSNYLLHFFNFGNIYKTLAFW